MFEQLISQLREHLERDPRHREGRDADLPWRDAGMPRSDFIETFPAHETNLGWLDKHVRASARRTRPRSAGLARYIERQQNKLREIEKRSHLTIAEIKEINREIASARRRRAARRRKWSRRTCAW